MQVTWDEQKCCHAGICVHSLPDVFKVEGDQLKIDATQASEDDVESTVRQCPSGALQIIQKINNRGSK